MTVQAFDWLPNEAFRVDAVRAVFADPVEAWSRDWFGQKCASISAIGFRSDGAPPPSVQRLTGAVVSAELHGRGKRHLLEAALGLSLVEQQLIDGDRRILDALATDIANDLIKRIEKSVRESVSAEGAQAELAVWLDAGEALTLICSQQSVIRELKRRMAPLLAPRAALQSRLQALTPTRVTANGVLGYAELTIGELEDLAVGDVLVLDRMLEQPVELRLSDTDRLVASGTLIRENGKTSLRL